MEFTLDLKRILTIAIFLVAMGNSYSLFGQCSQNNIVVAKYELRKSDGSLFSANDNFQLGQPVSGQLWVTLGGSTTNGYNLYMTYDIYVDNSISQSGQTNCIFTHQKIEQGVPTYVRNLTWNWGDKIQIKNIFMYWITGNVPNNNPPPCQESQKSNQNAQCYSNLEGFTAVTPLFPKFNFTQACNSTSVSFINSTTGGTSPYTFFWDFNNDGLPDSNLANPSYNFPSSGNYTVSLKVVDSQTPTQTETTVSKVVIITSPISVSATTTSTVINGSTGSIDVTVTGGTAPYTYLWTYPNGTTRTTEDISSLPKGTYSLLVTDALNCTQTAQFIIYDLLTPNFIYNPTLCNTQIQFSDTTLGGTPPINYTYSWDFDNDGNEDSNLPNPIYDFPGSGNYPVKLTVTNGTSIVSVTKNIFIDPNLTIQVDIFPTKIDDSSGIIYVKSVTGGTPPYTYSWTGPNGFTSTSKDIFNLSNGLYTLTVTDANGCTQTVSYELDIANVLGFSWKTFDLKGDQSQVTVCWEVTTPDENCTYEVERSAGDVSNFNTIGIVTGVKSPDFSQSYHFTDVSFPRFEDTFYYRIVRKMGSQTSYSPVKMILIEGLAETKRPWIVYPNPSFGGDIFIRYLGDGRAQEKILNIEVFNSGLIHQKVTLKTVLSSTINLKHLFPNLPSGHLILRIQSDHEMEVIQLIH